MKKMTVAVVGGNHARLEQVGLVFAEANIECVAADVPGPMDDFPDPIKYADGILFGGSWPVTRDIMDRLKNCRVIGRFGLGYDSIDVPAATERDIAVVVARGFCEEEMADHVIAFLLAWHRRIVFHDRTAKTGRTVPLDMPIPRISTLTIGLCGFGGVARNAARKLKSFGTHLIAYDPYVSDEAFSDFGVEKVGFPQLLAQSDVISIHCALTDDTRRLFSEETFEAMKPNALVINTARGAIIDTDALVSALEKKKIAGACLDVIEEGATHTYNLNQNDRILLTPHMAYNSEAALKDLNRIAAENVRSVLEGKIPNGLVNSEVAKVLHLI